MLLTLRLAGSRVLGGRRPGSPTVGGSVEAMASNEYVLLPKDDAQAAYDALMGQVKTAADYTRGGNPNNPGQLPKTLSAERPTSDPSAR